MQTCLISSKVVHLHLTRRCNLSCAHCYSNSSPAHKDNLSLVKIKELLHALRQEGYGTISLSGGEPLLYKYVTQVITCAKRIGYSVNLITNGHFVDRLIDEPYCKVDNVAVSLDGDEATHNKIRRNVRAYSTAIEAIKKLRDARIKVSIAYGVSRLSLSAIPQIVALAEQLGVNHLQLHPIVSIGRAKLDANFLALDQNDRETLFVMQQFLSRYVESMDLNVTCDLVPKDWILNNLQFSSDSSAKLSDKINPIVIDENGKLFPFAYGVHSSLEILLDTNSPKAFHKVEPKIKKIFQLSIEQNPQKYTDWYECFVFYSSKVFSTDIELIEI